MRPFSQTKAVGICRAPTDDNPLYNGIFMAFGAGELACSQVGAAWAALEEFEKHIRTTKPLLSSKPIFKYQHHDWQRIFGLAL